MIGQAAAPLKAEGRAVLGPAPGKSTFDVARDIHRFRDPDLALFHILPVRQYGPPARAEDVLALAEGGDEHAHCRHQPDDANQDQDAVHQRWLLQHGVRVAADDHIDSPGGIEHRGQLAVRVKAYVLSLIHI